MALGISSFSIYIAIFHFFDIFSQINHLKNNVLKIVYFLFVLFFLIPPPLQQHNNNNNAQFNRGCGGGSRKNSWGNLSYAELITRAIESSAEQRLTLSQIYEWIVRYVPYFKEKYDRTSSAGWKVSSNKHHSISSIVVLISIF